MSLPFIWLLCVVKADGEFIDFQMMLMMTTIYKNSPKWPFRKPSQSTALLVVQWTNTLPWLVVYASISLEKPGTVSVVAFDFPFVFCFVFFFQELKAVLLGSSLNCFSVEWRNQGFTFSETHDLRYGIVQKKVAILLKFKNL